jgi:FAD/FMN-containing dehydrogenase/Fe-S oxidoreductase
MPANPSEVERALKASVTGEVRFDPTSRALYSTDASIYQILPLGVVIPRDDDDIAATMRIAADAGTPILPRGAGTSLAGQSIGRAIILDCSKYMSRILELDAAHQRARVQPGVVQDDLNQAARPHGLRLGPDTATSNRATLGGMIGNNSCGARSIVYGKMMDHVQELRVMLIDGTELHLRRPDPGRPPAVASGQEDVIRRSVTAIVERNREEIGRRFPRLLRRVSGYNLDALVRDPADLINLLVGSEGTLGIVTEATVGLVPQPASTVLAVVHFADLFAALDVVPLILSFAPSAVELIDRMLLEMTRAQLEYARRMTFVQGDPDALLIVELSGATPAELADRLATMERALRAAGVQGAIAPATSAADQDNIWRVRKAGQGLLQGVKGDAKPIAFVEDTAVSPQRLAAYMRRFKALLDAQGVRAAIYAHASVGCLHVRPLIDLKRQHDIEKMKAIAEAVGELVIEFEGTMSGEHGDGLVRSWFVERFFGSQVYGAFQEIKTLFDPSGLMNPGKIVNGPPMDQSLRYGSHYRTQPIATVFDWSQDGGFGRSVELCSGLGACRKTSEGTMCPSYMVTREEEHSTRGRANLLRAVLSGVLPTHEVTGTRLYQALDLCLECKGCKAECPANVDMAKLKYEFLAQYYRVHGVPLRAWLFGHYRLLNHWGSRAAPLSTALAQSRPARWVLDRLVGIDRRRPLPPFARPNFLQWWNGHRQARAQVSSPPRARAGSRGPVALFADTFMIYNYPQVGRAAVEVLEQLGYEVELAPPVCCGRTLISKGLLPQAQAAARRNVDALLPVTARGVPIVGCEPSCLLTFRDEVPDLVPGEAAQTLARSVFLVEEFLANEHRRAPLPLAGGAGRHVLVHGHCHEKALAGTAPLQQVLTAAGYTVEMIDAGCCGMAGSFGFEKEHYEISMAIGERRLLPAVRRVGPDAVVAATGVSCRQQIAHGSGRRALHLVELLQPAVSHAAEHAAAVS